MPVHGVIDARHPERAAVRVVEPVVDVAVDELLLLVVRVHVGVLRDEERAVGVREERVQVARDPARVGEELGALRHRVAARERLEVPGLVRHQLLVVRLVPEAPRRVLVDAAPHGIDEQVVLRERGDGALACGGVAVRVAAELEHDVEAERRLLHLPPARLLLVVVAVHVDDDAARDPREGRAAGAARRTGPFARAAPGLTELISAQDLEEDLPW